MDFTKNDSGQCYIINAIKILTKQGTDMIHAVISSKYHKYPSTKINKHGNILAKLKTPHLPSGDYIEYNYR